MMPVSNDAHLLRAMMPVSNDAQLLRAMMPVSNDAQLLRAMMPVSNDAQGGTPPPTPRHPFPARSGPWDFCFYFNPFFNCLARQKGVGAGRSPIQLLFRSRVA